MIPSAYFSVPFLCLLRSSSSAQCGIYAKKFTNLMYAVAQKWSFLRRHGLGHQSVRGSENWLDHQAQLVKKNG